MTKILGEHFLECCESSQSSSVSNIYYFLDIRCVKIEIMTFRISNGPKRIRMDTKCTLGLTPFCFYRAGPQGISERQEALGPTLIARTGMKIKHLADSKICNQEVQLVSDFKTFAQNGFCCLFEAQIIIPNDPKWF